MIIDFASGKSSAEASKFCLESKIPLIIGSTGQSESELKTIEDCAKGVPILVCRNFSIGISILKRCILEVYRQVMPQATILEKHHGEKKDVPSGTAIELKEFIQKLSNGSVQILSERGGKEIGTHRLDFYFGDELVSFSHQAFSRDAFLKGVELSAEFMLSVSSPKLYSLDDVLN